MALREITLELTRDEARAVRFALALDYETVSENIGSPDAIKEWKKDQILMESVLSKLDKELINE